MDTWEGEQHTLGPVGGQDGGEGRGSGRIASGSITFKAVTHVECPALCLAHSRCKRNADGTFIHISCLSSLFLVLFNIQRDSNEVCFVLGEER